mgnify:CR=1 FL=1
MYGKGFRKVGNIEPYLSYKKLHRTGRLLRGIKAKHLVTENGAIINLFNNVPYAQDQELGLRTPKAQIPKESLQGGATGGITGGDIEARPFMQPSEEVLNHAQRSVEDKMRSFGW